MSPARRSTGSLPTLLVGLRREQSVSLHADLSLGEWLAYWRACRGTRTGTCRRAGRRGIQVEVSSARRRRAAAIER